MSRVGCEYAPDLNTFVVRELLGLNTSGKSYKFIPAQGSKHVTVCGLSLPYGVQQSHGRVTATDSVLGERQSL